MYKREVAEKCCVEDMYVYIYMRGSREVLCCVEDMYVYIYIGEAVEKY